MTRFPTLGLCGLSVGLDSRLTGPELCDAEANQRPGISVCLQMVALTTYSKQTHSLFITIVLW